MGPCKTDLMNMNENTLRPAHVLQMADVAKMPAPRLGDPVIRSRICICCGEPMVERGNALSRNPNVCASCSSMADGMEEANRSNAALDGRAAGRRDAS